MGIIIDFNARRAQSATAAEEPEKLEKSADILVFTGVRYEAKNPPVADQSRSGKG